MKSAWFFKFSKMLSTTSAWDFYKTTKRVTVLLLIRIVHYLQVIRRIIRYSELILLSDSNAWRTSHAIGGEKNDEIEQLDRKKQNTKSVAEFQNLRMKHVDHRNSIDSNLRGTNGLIGYYNNSCLSRRINFAEKNVDSIKVNHKDRRRTTLTTTVFTSEDNLDDKNIKTIILPFRPRSMLQSTKKNIFLFYFVVFSLYLKCAITACNAFSIRDVIHGSGKRTAGIDAVICPTWHPFQCPNGDCIPIKYLCDGSPDCSDEYDEDKRMCTAAVRPPVEETAAFLRALLSAHGNDFLVKLFGANAKDEMRAMGGVDKVAVAISQSPTIEAFGTEMRLKPNEVERLAEVLESIISGDTSELTYDEAGDFRFFVEKLQETGFF